MKLFLIPFRSSLSSELTSPTRCLSRDSRDSTGARSPSEESIYSGRGLNMASPLGMSNLQPSAAALLPPQSAAMAAYLGVAAAAAQQNRLNFLSGLSGSPPLLPPGLTGLSELGAPILDFSAKRGGNNGTKSDLDGNRIISDSNDKSINSRSDEEDDEAMDDDLDEEENEDSVMNLSNKSMGRKRSEPAGGSNNSPLDLTMSRKRGATVESQSQMGTPSSHLHPRKQSRPIDFKQWPYGGNVVPGAGSPYFANSNLTISPKGSGSGGGNADWNGAAAAAAKMKMMNSTSDATKALEKMSELSRLGGSEDHPSSTTLYSKQAASSSNNMMHSTGRHSAWQSHWLNKGADSAKDVLKCVWCKQSFPSLAAMTTHMKETKHCGVNVPPNTGSSSGHNQPPMPHPHQNRDRGDSSGGKNDLNLLIKETMPLPRKLVRGQDVWLGKGAEQTRQILKCMWCGQSFRSLAEMTSHMQQTQHYTNIISQEQIISWKSAEENKGGPGGGGGPPGPGGPASGGPSTPHSQANVTANSTVSAVLTCKVCDQAFSSLKDLSNHMVKNAHYKEHIMRSITESGSRRRQTREKRKKSLPVRKLLELERAQHDFKNGGGVGVGVGMGSSAEMASMSLMSKTMREAASGRITCEKCGDKIDTTLFVEHIRQCVGGTVPARNKSNNMSSSDSVSPMTPNSRDGRKSINDDLSSPVSRHISPGVNHNDSRNSPKENSGQTGDKNSSPSVLNAIEQLIEKSFDTRPRHNNSGVTNSNQSSTPLGASILKRLGIDESVDYTKPLIDPQTMNLLRNYQQHHHQLYGRGRERSGSESSTFSDRASSRLESLTPERKYEPSNSHSVSSRHSPDSKEGHEDRNGAADIKIKREPTENEDLEIKRPDSMKIKKEIDPEEDDKTQDAGDSDDENVLKRKKLSSPVPSPHRTPIATPVASPASDRSNTPRSVASDSKSKAHLSGSSLGALSSMFDNLTGVNNNESSTAHNSSGYNKEGSTGSNRNKASHHPLAALQKLCDKTENTPQQQNSRANSASSNHSSASLATAMPPAVSTSNAQAVSNAGAGLLAFSWACNDAVMTSDSIMKCAFCDTPFISKGAYRHHLSKMHFVKDDMLPDAVAMKTLSSQKNLTPSQASKSPTPPAISPKGEQNRNGMLAASSNNRSRSKSPAQAPPTASSASPSNPGVTFEESPHSKFLKYTELAKQLSSKYV